MQDEVRLNRSRLNVLPLTPRPDRYLCFQPCRCRSRPPRLPAQVLAPAPQLAVDRRRAHREQGPPAHSPATAPLRAAQGRPRAMPTPPRAGCRTSGHRPPPYPDQRFCHFRTVAPRPAGLLGHGNFAAAPAQEPDRRLPVHLRRLAKLVQDPALLLLPRSPVAPPHRRRILVQRRPRHVTPFR